MQGPAWHKHQSAVVAIEVEPALDVCWSCGGTDIETKGPDRVGGTHGDGPRNGFGTTVVGGPLGGGLRDVLRPRPGPGHRDGPRVTVAVSTLIDLRLRAAALFVVHRAGNGQPR